MIERDIIAFAFRSERASLKHSPSKHRLIDSHMIGAIKRKKVGKQLFKQNLTFCADSNKVTKGLGFHFTFQLKKRYKNFEIKWTVVI